MMVNIIETNLDFETRKFTNTPTTIVLHHAAHSSCSVYDVHRWHKHGNGWNGIGYHFFISKEGKLYRGRSEDSVEVHCANHNGYTFGICVQGNYMKEYMSNKQKKALTNVCKYLIDRYNIRSIKRHKDLRATSCPGKNFPFYETKKSVICRDSYIDTYTVKSGDTLYSISKEFNMTVDDLKRLNGLTGNIIYPNQILRII